MLKSVAEISVLSGLSKVSIYNKIKLKEIEPFVVKNKGITYVSDEGVALICGGLKLKQNDLNALNDKLKEDDDNGLESIENKEIEDFKVELKELKLDYINSLKLEIENLKAQLKEKDKQIDSLLNLNQNNQILLKQQQDKEIKKLEMDEHFSEVDSKLEEIREKMSERAKNNEKKKFFGLFSK
ncbi:MAG: hypothetical protein PUE01_14830 [Clostridiaceae bacterium]|nr:hypothetical protein [Clostridiaceae bacterium]